MSANNFRPEPFTCRRDQDIDVWFDTYEKYVEFAGWNNVRKFLGLKNMLQGNAGQWLRTVDLEEINTYDLLKDAVSTKYRLNQAQLFQIRQGLLERRQ